MKKKHGWIKLLALLAAVAGALVAVAAFLKRKGKKSKKNLILTKRCILTMTITLKMISWMAMKQ